MADKIKLGAKISLDGEKEFRQAVSGINTDIKVLTSEMKKVTSEFIGNENSIEALTAKEKVLNKQLETQEEKIKKVKEALENSVKQYGASAEKTKKWQATLNDAEGDLNKLNNEVKKNKESMEKIQNPIEEATKDVKEFAKSSDKASDNTSKWSSKLSGVSSNLGSGFAGSIKAASVGIAALAATTVAAVAGMSKMVSSSVESADKIAQTAEVYGLTAERVQELTYVGTKLDVELDTITNAQSKLTKTMFEAKDGTGAQADAFKNLGISIVGSNGQLKDAKTVMSEAFTALGKMSNETERDALAMKIFGKSAMELNPLIKAGGLEIAKLTEEARKNGAVMSNEAIAGLDNFGDSVEALKLSAKGIAGTFATSLLPAMNGAVEFSKGLIPVFQDAIKTGDFDNLGKMIGDGLSKAISGIVIGMEKMLPVVINILTSLTSSIVSAIPKILPALTNGLITLLDAFVGIISDNGTTLIEAGMSAIATLVEGILEALPEIIQAGLDIIVQLALGIAEALPELIPTVVSTLMTIVETLIDNIDVLIDASIAIIMALADGLITALPILIDKLPVIIDKLIMAITNNLPKLIEMGIKLNIALAKGLIKAIPQLLSKIPEIIVSIVKGFGNLVWKMMPDVGKDLVSGIWDGIKNSTGWLLDKIKSFGSDVMDGIKNFFGIKSPSKLMKDQVGKNLALGISDGFGDEMKNVSAKMNKSIPTSFNTEVLVNQKTISESESVQSYRGGNIFSDMELLKSLISDAVGERVLKIQFGDLEFETQWSRARNNIMRRTGSRV